MIKRLILKFNMLSENNKIVIRNVIGAFAVKGLSLVVSLFTMPAYLRFFNDEISLGLWFTILSVISWILNFDLGIGNGLRNKLTEAITKNRLDEAKKFLSSAYISVGILCIVISVVFVAIFDFVDWNKIFKIESDIISSNALLLTVKIVFVGIMLQLFFNLITSVLYALQMSFVNNFLSLITSVLNLVAVLLLPSGNNDENMIIMAIVHTIAVLLPLIVTTICIFFGRTLRKSIPSVKAFSIKYAKSVLSLGGAFLFVQIAYMVIMGTNEYLITYFCGSAAVVNYNIYYKLFSLGATIFTLALTPIWSAVTKAFAENNYLWIEKIYKKLLLFASLGGCLELLLTLLLQIFIDLWLGDESIKVNLSYGLVFALLCTLMIFNSVMSSIANGIAKLKTQAFCFAIGSILKIPLAYLLVKLTNTWIGVVMANAAVLSIYCIVQPFTIRKFLSEKEVD